MEIIPVIDLLNGQVVHAKLGDRQNYKPICSSLCKSSKISEVIESIKNLYAFTNIYIADIDAIQEKGSHLKEISEIRRNWPDINIWLDAGVTTSKHIIELQDQGINIVLGTESIINLSQYSELASASENDHILSLDFRNNAYTGPIELVETNNHWPNLTIIMSLNKVGSNEGPDLHRLKELKIIAQKRRIYAAGGIRDLNDLKKLKSIGVHGVLIASSLHNGMINAKDIHFAFNQL